MIAYIQVSVLAVVALSANAIPLGEHELSSATSYSSSNQGYQGYDDGLSHLGNLGGYDSSSLDLGDHDIHVSAPVITQHVLTPIVKKVPVFIKHETVEHEEEHHEPKKYEFHYAVEDKHTGDIKSQKEVSDGHVVQGEYSLKEADGTTRVVKYSADKKNGFNAVVIRKGHAAHPQVVHKKVEVKKLFVPIVDHHDNYQQIYSHY